MRTDGKEDLQEGAGGRMEEEQYQQEASSQLRQAHTSNGYAGPRSQGPQSQPQPQQQQASSTSSRVLVGGGLANGTGQNHCYLNVVVQSLWSLRAFRDRICRGVAITAKSSSSSNSATSSSSSSLQQALRAVMEGLIKQEADMANHQQQGERGQTAAPTPVVSVDGLRQVLSELVGQKSAAANGAASSSLSSSSSLTTSGVSGSGSGDKAGVSKFRAGHMDDAVEAFEEILGLLGAGGGEGQRAVRDSFCLNLREVMLCPGCGCPSPSPARDYDTNVFYVPVRSLVEESERRNPPGGQTSMAAAMAQDFGALLQGAGSGDLYRCRNTERCPVARRGDKHAGHRYLVGRAPLVFSLGLVWDSLKGDPQETQALIGLIAPVLRLGHFKLPLQQQPHQGQGQQQGECVGVLKGFFAFHPQKHHYVAFLFHPGAGWVCLDDGVGRLLGPTHVEALQQCGEEHYQPSLLFYEVTQK